ncbi:hypothetical protein PIB30_081244 [Stylosanthes scabra]|uniref:Aminotransferase-like plant mobile domain-containing protein n=1 Tax=Stylosanthes scabra TaxID=79078 RepID=A0ABU6XU79_9FABA|nr:hypothetical protein [Stylosanthes scabra]
MRATELLGRLVAVSPWCTPGYIRDFPDGVLMDGKDMFSLSLLSQTSRDHHVGRISRLRYEIDTLRFDDFIWTPYILSVWGGICPAWISDEGELQTWRASVSIVCFMFVQYHPANRVKRQFGFEQPIPVDPPLDGAEDGRSSDQGCYTLDTTIPTREYAEWWGRVCKARYLSLDDMLHDPRVAQLPADAPLQATQPRDSIVLPTDAPSPRRSTRQQQADIRRREPRMGQGGQQRPLGGEDTDEEQSIIDRRIFSRGVMLMPMMPRQRRHTLRHSLRTSTRMSPMSQDISPRISQNLNFLGGGCRDREDILPGRGFWDSRSNNTGD